jgi:hypothetical protein
MQKPLHGKIHRLIARMMLQVENTFGSTGRKVRPAAMPETSWLPLTRLGSSYIMSRRSHQNPTLMIFAF